MHDTSGNNNNLAVLNFSSQVSAANNNECNQAPIRQAVDALSPARIGSYFIDLNFWKISNDFTNPLATSQGINAALQWARDNGFTEAVLPQGNYLIEKNTPITIPSYMTFNLNGSTLKLESNELSRSKVIFIDSKTNVTICNGIIEGDKLTHDYSKTTGDTWGEGILIINSKNIRIDGIKVKNVTGSGITTGGNYNHIAWIYLSNLESGTFDNNGLPMANQNFTRTNIYFPLANDIIDTVGWFSLYGNGYGSYGTSTDDKELDFDLTFFTVYFYDENNRYLGSITRRTFDGVYKQYFPAGATKCKISFRYDYSKIKTSTMTLRANTTTDRLFITNCEVAGCRTLGMNLSGSQNVIVENCEIHGVGGAAPGYGIDIEDGYNTNQNIIIRNCYFHDNKNGSIVVISARNVLLEHNKFYGGVTMHGAKGQNYVSQYNLYNGCHGSGVSNAGDFGSNLIFNGDAFVESNLYLDGNPQYINCSFDNTTFILSCNNYETVKFINCTFNFDRKDIGWSWMLRKGSLLFEKCTLNIVYAGNYYFRNENYSLDSISKCDFTMNNCIINTKASLGYTGTVPVSCNKLTFTNNKLVGTHDATYQPTYFKANQAIISNNDIDSVSIILEGIGTEPRLIVTNNEISYNKTGLYNYIFAKEGIFIKNFNYVEYSQNTVFLPLRIANFHVLYINCEKFVKIDDNTLISPNVTSKIKLSGAYRALEDTTPIPALLVVLNNNYIQGISIERDAAYSSQLSKAEIGNGSINI